MSFEIHRNVERGHVNHGWLQSAHSFSFADYYNPHRMNFGALLAINEDIIQPKSGFGEHGHENMEIITVPLSGSLQHEDSMGSHSVIHAGEIQIMSAGTGVRHSEQNPSSDIPVHLLQIWVIPDTQGLTPRYEQATITPNPSDQTFTTLVSPFDSEGLLHIHQNAWISNAHLNANQTDTLPHHIPANGLFVFVIEGAIQCADQKFETGDAIALRDKFDHSITASTNSRVLIFEVPLLTSQTQNA